MDLLVKVSAQFIEKGARLPVTGNEYLLKLYDKDIIDDDFLGESSLDDEGNAFITFNPRKISSADSPFEADPDLYFILYKSGSVVYKSQILEDINIKTIADFDTKDGLHFDLGTFVIEIL